MPGKLTARGSPSFTQKVDQAFFARVEAENGGHLPAGLTDAKGNPRKLTMSPADRAYRQEWNAIAANMRKSRAAPQVKVKAAAVSCPAGKTKLPPVMLPSKKLGKPVLVGSVLPPVSPPRKITATKKAHIPCNLVSSSVTCEHGRQAVNGVLCVVPDSYASIGDQISCKAVLKGGCGKHLEWSVTGMWTSTEHGSSAKVLAKTFKPALLGGWLGLQHISPQTYQIQVVACEGETPSVELRAYPPDKLSGKIEFEEVRKKIKEWLSHAPIDDATKDELEKGWFVGAIEFEQQWKEDRSSYRSFCESSVKGAFDPFFGAKLPPVPIYPLNIVPVPLQKWLKAGVYVSLEGGFSFTVELFWAYWPDTDESHYEKTEVALFGRVTGTLSVNLFVVNKDVVNAQVSGSTGLKAGGKFFGETPPAVEFFAQWTGLDAAVCVKIAWGWIEYNRTYPLLKERDIGSYKHSFGANAGPASGE